MTKQLRVRRGLLISASMIAALAIGVYVERFGLLHGVHDADSSRFYDTIVDLRYYIKNNYVEPIDDKKLLQGAVDGMLGQLDPYSNYFTKDELQAFDRQTSGKFSGIGAEMSQDPSTGEIIVISPIEDSPALKAGMLAGDHILKVNGDSIEGLSFKDVAAKLSGLPGSDIHMTVVHEGEKTPIELDIKRAVVQVHSIKGFKLHDDGSGTWDFLIDPEHRIAYVRITSFMETTAEDLDKALLPLLHSPQGLRGIVLDLRINPGGLLTAGIDVSNRFLDSGVIVSTRGRDGKNQFVAEAKKENTYPRTPLVVLVNEYSASASEIVAGALKDHNRAVLIGNRTFGKGSVQNLISLNDGESALKLTTAYYYLPSGKNIARKKGAKTWGVEPDPAFLIPFTDAENRALVLSHRDSEIIRPHVTTTLPVAGGTTIPATQAAAPAASSQPSFTDRQLQRAMEVLIAYQSFNGDKPLAEVTTTHPSASASISTQPAPATSPATLPATAPATAPASAPATAPETQPEATQPATTTSQPASTLNQTPKTPTDPLIPN